jgi:AraC-like DNA-binding protein
MDSHLSLFLHMPVQVTNGGLFVSRGVGVHPRRVIDSYELIYVKRGTLAIEETGTRFEVGAEETLVLWPGREHGGTLPFPPDLQFFWVHFAMPDIGHSASEIALQIPQHAYVNRPEHMTGLFRRLLNEQNVLGDRMIPMSLMVMQMLWEVTSSRAVGGALDGQSAVLAGRADAIIRTEFHQPISASSIAAQLGCNPDYLGRIFRTHFRCTLTEAIHTRRARHATNLLSEGKQSIDDIARHCGFEDTGYFRRVFKKELGMSPRAYRALHLRLHINTD